MKIGTIARRYAQALYEAATDVEQTEEIGAELAHFVDVLDDNPFFRAVFNAPTMPSVRKRALIKDTFGDELHPYLLNFFCLLFDKDREAALRQINVAYQERLLEDKGLLVVELTSAAPLSSAQEERLKSLLRRRHGKDIYLRQSLDPDLLGGAVLRIGDRVIDGSLRTRLTRLRTQLKQEV